MHRDNNFPVTLILIIYLFMHTVLQWCQNYIFRLLIHNVFSLEYNNVLAEVLIIDTVATVQPVRRNSIHFLHFSITLVSLHLWNDSISYYSMYGFPLLTVMVLLLDDLCAMTINDSNFQIHIWRFFNECIYGYTIVKNLNNILGPCSCSLFPLPSSCQNPSDL